MSPAFIVMRARGSPRVFIADVPDDLVGELQEPLHAVVAVKDRQHEFLGGRAKEALLAHGRDRRIPRHVRARQVFEETERMQRALNLLCMKEQSQERQECPYIFHGPWRRPAIATCAKPYCNMGS